MTNIHETAYPISPAEPSAAELKASFIPTTAEMRFGRRQSRQESTAVLIMVQLKLLQRLGYFPMLSDVPHIIIDHLSAAFRIRSLPRTRISRYDRSGTRARHQKLLRAYVDIRQLNAGATQWLTTLASESAQTKVELPDIVNVLIEELIRRRYELPPLAGLLRIATQARSEIHETIYRAITDGLDDSLIARIDALFVVHAGKSGWDEVKCEPKRPAARAIASFLKHIQGMRKLADGLQAVPTMLSVSKRAQLVIEARALGVAEFRSLKASKRYALAVLFIQAQLQKALDDVTEIFIKVMRKFEASAKTRLQQYHVAHADALEGLVGQFRDMLQILQDEGIPERRRLAIIRESLGDDPGSALVRCNEHIAYAGNFDLPFMLVPYRQQRSLLFQCLDILPLHSSSQDRSVLIALAWLRGFRNAHREHLPLSNNDLASPARLDAREVGKSCLPARSRWRHAAPTVLRAVCIPPDHA
jgi:uncharacterized protein DUF4158